MLNQQTRPGCSPRRHPASHLSPSPAPLSCVEYLRLSTNEGRALEIGNADSPLQTIASYPNRASGFLAAVRGYEEYAKAEGGATMRGPLKTLQMVWANCNVEGGASECGRGPAKGGGAAKRRQRDVGSIVLATFGAHA